MDVSDAVSAYSRDGGGVVCRVSTKSPDCSGEEVVVMEVRERRVSMVSPGSVSLRRPRAVNDPKEAGVAIGGVRVDGRAFPSPDFRVLL